MATNTEVVTAPSPSECARSYWITFAAACIFLCLPVVTVRYAPLVDYPSHLARAYILSQYRDVPIYQQNYVETREVLPNLAIDLTMPFLLRFVGLVTASKIFLSSIVLLFAMGSHMLGRSIQGRPTKAAILCMFLVYNSMLLYGFVNYLVGIGIFCIALALWLRWRLNFSAIRVFAIAALVFCAYLAHLTACAYLGLAIFVIGIFDFRSGRSSWRSLLLPMVLFIPEVVFYLAYHHVSVSAVSWGTLRQKVIAGLPLVLSYNYHFDVFFIFVTLCMGLYALRYVHIRPESMGEVVAGLCFIVLYIVTPHYWLGGSPVDGRFVLPAAILIILSLTIQMPRRTANILFSLCLLVFSVRVVTIWRTWCTLDRRIEGQVQVFSTLPDGATLYPAVPLAESGEPLGKSDRAFIHVAEIATIVRHAFVPTQLAIPGQEIVLFRHPLPHRTPTRLSSEWIAAMRQYDFVWSFGLPEDLKAVIQANCDLVSEKDGFSLWRVRKSDH